MNNLIKDLAKLSKQEQKKEWKNDDPTIINQ